LFLGAFGADGLHGVHLQDLWGVLPLNEMLSQVVGGYYDIMDENMDEEHIDIWIGVVIDALSELDFGNMP